MQCKLYCARAPNRLNKLRPFITAINIEIAVNLEQYKNVDVLYISNVAIRIQTYRSRDILEHKYE